MQQGSSDSPEVLERYQSELSLVEVIAGQVSRAIGTLVDYDDLLSAGREGLFDAARKYDSSRGVPFRAYANLRVKGAVLDGVRQQTHLPRRAHERLAALQAAMVQSEGELGAAFALPNRNLAAGEAESRMTAHLANMATAAAFGITASSDDAGSDGSTEAAANPEEQLAQAELVALVRRTIDELSPDEAGVIRAYYFEGKSMGDIAEVENLSKSWVCRLHAQAMGRLTRRIKNST